MEKGDFDDVFDDEGEANNVIPSKNDSYDNFMVAEDLNTAGQGSREDSNNPDVMGDSNNSYDAEQTGPGLAVSDTGYFQSGAMGASVRFSDTLGEPSSGFPLSAVGSDVMRLVDQNSDNPGALRSIPASGSSSTADGAASGPEGADSIAGAVADSYLAKTSEHGHNIDIDLVQGGPVKTDVSITGQAAEDPAGEKQRAEPQGPAADSYRKGSSASLDIPSANPQELKRSATTTAGRSGDEASRKAEAADAQGSDAGLQPAYDDIPSNDSRNNIAAGPGADFDTNADGGTAAAPAGAARAGAETDGPAAMSLTPRGGSTISDLGTGFTGGLNHPVAGGVGRWEQLGGEIQQGDASRISSGATASEGAFVNVATDAASGTETGSLGAGASHSRRSSDEDAGLTAATATATAETTLEPAAEPTVAERAPRTGTPESGATPLKPGSARRHSYVSPQYDQFDKSASSLSSESRTAAADGRTLTLSATPQRLTDSATGERSLGTSSSSKPWRSNSARRSSAAGISLKASPRSSGHFGPSSEVSAPGQPSGDGGASSDAPGQGNGDGGASGEGGHAAEDMGDQTSWRQSGTASSGGGGGGSSSGRQNSVSYAWRGSSGGGESGGAAPSRPGSSDSAAQPRLTAAANRSASFSSETSSVARRISGTYVAYSLDDGPATAMVAVAPSLPPLGSQSDDRCAAPPHSAPGEARRPASQGGGGFPGGPNPLPPLPSSSSTSSVHCPTERSKPRSAVSAPAGDIRMSAGGMMAAAAPLAAGAAAAAAATATASRGSRWPPQTHLMPTHVQPKGPFDECTVQAAMQHVRTVWSTSNICGIRSLPNALSPDFRDRLYEELVQAAHRDRSFVAPSHKPQLSYGLEGGPLGMPLSVGQKQVARINPLAGMFTQFEYLPSEYDRVKLTGKYDRLKHKLAQTAPQEFVVRATPTAPHGAPAFSEFSYATDPVDSYSASMHADTDLARSKVMAGPFYPSGRVSSAKVLKGRLDECMMRLCKHLSDDWPNSFLQVFEDSNGSVVASFHMASAVQEGDLSSYMNTLCKRNHLVATYQLVKDATRWGLVDEGSGAVFYVMWPPWVRHRYLGPHTAPPANEVPNGRPGTRGSNSSEEDEDGYNGGGEDMSMGLATDLGDGGQNGALGYGNQPSDLFAATGQQRRTGVF